jgi:hypothetical protein
MMSPFRYVVHAFANTFGITRPEPQQEAAAGRFIALMLLAVMVFLGAAAWLLSGILSR